MPKYFNRLKDGQKNAACASLPISDKWLTSIATSKILAENSFPTAQEKWDELPSTEKIWVNHFINAKAAIEHATQARGGSFGSANSAALFHETSTLNPSNGKVLSNTVGNFNGYLNNISVTDTNKRDVLNRLVANNDRLTTNNDTTLTDAKTLLTNGANTHANGGSSSGLVVLAGRGYTSSEVAALKRQVQRLWVEIRFKWMNIGLCSTHGWGVSKSHDRNACLRKGKVHVTTAPQSNPAGPGATKTKGGTIFGPDGVGNPVVVVTSI